MEYKFNPEDYGYRSIGVYKNLNVVKYLNGGSIITHDIIVNKFKIGVSGSTHYLYNGKITSSWFARELLLNLDVDIRRNLLLSDIIE